MTLTYVTVCSGIECMSVACRGLPLKPVFFSEIEPFPCAVLKAHYPNGSGFSQTDRKTMRRNIVDRQRERRAMLERLRERDREYAAWAGERGKPRVRDFRPKDIQGIANEDLRRWY